MLGLEHLAEQRIQEAIGRGEFDDLPGAGQPLALEDDPLIPEDLRLAYRILKNSGFVPPEVDAMRRIAELERWLEGTADSQRRHKASVRLSLLRTRLEAHSRRSSTLDDRRYAQKLLNRLEHSHDK